ncbi:MAG TPA: DUF4926 domain-containing protein [Candidatus Polarisedimenticolaceae bacterium]|nr:DUF4926 domain-containing protein [Candidatus Polarisedimenticolaceae bacterium]
MKYELNDTVVLLSDLANHELKAGDIGAVVHIYSDDAVEVEFVTASGRTAALVTLPASDVRAMTDSDRMTVRSVASR